MNSYLKQIIKNKNWGLLKTLIDSHVIIIDEELIDVVCEMNCDDIYELLRVIPSINSPLVEKKMLKWSLYDTLYKYCYDFVGPDERFKKAFLEKTNSEYVFRYARYIKRSHDEEIFNYLFLSEDCDYSFFIDYAKYIPDAPLEVMESLILNGNNSLIKEFLELEKLKDYPQLVKELLNTLKINNASKEISELILKIDAKLFNFETTYLYNYIKEICAIAVILDYKELYLLISKLQDLRLIDLLNIVLVKKEKEIRNLSDEEKFNLLVFFNEQKDYATIKRYRSMFSELFTDSLTRKRENPHESI